MKSENLKDKFILWGRIK